MKKNFTKNLLISCLSLGALAYCHTGYSSNALTIEENGNVEFHHNVKINSVDVNNYLVPKGSIMMWYGQKENVPNDWLICDGNNNTPNLIGRFPFGVSNEYVLGAQGGNQQITLNQDQLPSHSHTVTINNAGQHNHGIRLHTRGFNSNGGDQATTDDDDAGAEKVPNTLRTVGQGGDHTHSATISNTGSNAPVNILPPFTAVYFIMKK